MLDAVNRRQLCPEVRAYTVIDADKVQSQCFTVALPHESLSRSTKCVGHPKHTHKTHSHCIYCIGLGKNTLFVLGNCEINVGESDVQRAQGPEVLLQEGWFAAPGLVIDGSYCRQHL